MQRTVSGASQNGPWLTVECRQFLSEGVQKARPGRQADVSGGRRRYIPNETGCTKKERNLRRVIALAVVLGSLACERIAQAGPITVKDTATGYERADLNTTKGFDDWNHGFPCIIP